MNKAGGILGEMKRRAKQRVDVTLDELYELMQKGFAEVESRFTLVEARIDQRSGVTNDRLNSMDVRLNTIERGLAETKKIALDTMEEAVSINFAIENDAKRYFDHEKRTVRLEKIAA